MTGLTKSIFMDKDFLIDLDKVPYTKHSMSASGGVYTTVFCGEEKPLVIESRDDVDDFQQALIDFWNTKYGF